MTSSSSSATCDAGISHYAFLWVFLVILLFVLIFASFWAYNRYVVRRKEGRDNAPHS